METTVLGVYLVKVIGCVALLMDSPKARHTSFKVTVNPTCFRLMSHFVSQHVQERKQTYHMLNRARQVNKIQFRSYALPLKISYRQDQMNVNSDDGTKENIKCHNWANFSLSNTAHDLHCNRARCNNRFVLCIRI